MSKHVGFNVEGIDCVVKDERSFKSQLYIGSDAYASSRVVKSLSDLWDVAGAAATGGVLVSSTTVASTFFAPSGILGIIGIGTAVTPIGWVVAAAVVSGGAWYGVVSYCRDIQKDRVEEIPKFINTPLDILAISLFDLLAPLAICVANADGKVSDDEIQAIHNYFVAKWGYSPEFVDEGLVFIINNIEKYSVDEVAKSLAKFKKQSKDCNYKEMSRSILLFLRNIVESDGVIDDKELEVLSAIDHLFAVEGRNQFQVIKEKVSKPSGKFLKTH
ncbi:MAG: TerB family tellurite resistance protein [Gammaproteobacteria bacterium]|nr:TerB family tellurite resistance protein [Gammaproteobacteria bacterium]